MTILLSAVPVLPLIISVALMLLCMAIPWETKQIKTWQIALVCVILLAFWIAGAAALLNWYPWASLLDFLVPVGLGILLGRVIPSRFVPFLIFLVVMSILDITQILLLLTRHIPFTQNTGTLSSSFYVNFLLDLFFTVYHFGPADLLILAAIGVYWARQQRAYFLLGPIGEAIGLVLAYAVLSIAHNVSLPLIPFLSLGWLCSVAIYRARKRPQATETEAPLQGETA